jgi:hypothetical protein
MDMIKGYKSFLILEKLKELQLILEGNIEFSDLFREKLFDIKPKSKLAEDIYNLQGEYYDDKILKNNFIDVTDKEDKVTFISQVKFDQIQSGSDEDIDPYKVKGRVEIGVGRCVRALADIANIKFTDKELEDFVNLYKSKNITEGEEFDLVKGKDIKYWYSEDNYFDGYGEGSLSNSCMADVDKSYFDIYSDSKSCQLLILTKKMKGKKLLIGRALVWNPSEIKLKEDVDFKGAEYFMDRIYCMKDSDEKKFLNYADEQGWLVKANNNSDNIRGMILKLRGETVKLKIVCKVEGDCDDYPYMDTLKYLSKEKNEISNIGFKKGYVLEDTDGDFSRCDDCDGKGSSECDDCYGDGRVECDDCGGEGEITKKSGKLKDCKDCKGKGEIDCPTCKGSGYSGLCDECTGLIKRL